MNELIIGGVILIVTVLVVRIVGAWMLRIDDIIKNQKIIIKELKSINNKTKGEDIRYMSDD